MEGRKVSTWLRHAVCERNENQSLSGLCVAGLVAFFMMCACLVIIRCAWEACLVTYSVFGMNKELGYQYDEL